MYRGNEAKEMWEANPRHYATLFEWLPRQSAKRLCGSIVTRYMIRGGCFDYDIKHDEDDDDGDDSMTILWYVCCFDRNSQLTSPFLNLSHLN